MANLPPPVSPELKGNPAGKTVYTVRLPDGSEVDVEGPANATPQQLQQFVAQQSGHPPPLVDSRVDVGSFGDDPQPREAASRLAPEDEQQLIHILQTGTADEARRFVASKGRTGPDNFDEVIAHRDRGEGVNKNVVYLLPKPINDKSMQAPGAFVRGIGSDIPFFDELGALADTLGGTKGRENILNSHDTFGDIYRRNLDINRGILDADEADHPVARITGQIIGGLAIPSGLEGVGLNAGKAVLRAGGTIREARAAAAAAVRNRMITVGSAYGAAQGAGNGEGVGGRLLGGVVGGLEGGATGGAFGGAGELIAPRLAASAAEARAAPIPEAQQIAAAADRQDVPLFAPDVGGPATRRLAGAMSQSITGAPPLAAAGKDVADAVRARRDQIAANVGSALQPEAAGQDAAGGARQYIVNSGAEARRFYAPAEKASQGIGLDTPKALAALDENIASLKETPGGAPGLETLQGLRDALASGNVSVAGIRRMRTVLRDQFRRDGLTGSDIERRVNQVVDAAAEDVRDGLSANGLGDAATSFAQGDAAWRTRAATIDQVLKPIIGTRDAPKSGEQVIKTLMADLQGNNARAVRFLNSLPPVEQGNLRASIIGGLGRVGAGKADAEGNGFSLSSFLTHWNQIGESAKAAYFGPEARAALNDLARVAQGSKEAQRYANHSNTTGGVIGNLLFTLLGQGVGGVKTAGATLIAPYAVARLLASPRFARWVARAPRTSLGTPAYIDRLSRIARAEPAIADDVLNIQKWLSSAANDNISSAAASGGSQQQNTQGQ